MSYGSYLGDGSERGVDYTADSLHQMAVAMNKYYEIKITEKKGKLDSIDAFAIKGRVRAELRNNAYDESKNVIVLNDAQVHAWKVVIEHYKKWNDPSNGNKIFGQVIEKESEIKDMAAFFYWGAWLSATARPGETYSYTHNCPHESLAVTENPTSDTTKNPTSDTTKNPTFQVYFIWFCYIFLH